LALAAVVVVSCSGLRAAEPPRDHKARAVETRIDALRRAIRVARMDDPAAVLLRLKLGKLLRDLWHEHRALAQRRKWEGDLDATQLKYHARSAKVAFEEAVRTLAAIHRERPKSKAAPEALFYLGVLHEEAREHEACAEACRAILKRYPDAQIPAVVGKRIQFNVYGRLGGACAALGKRTEAVDAFVSSLLAAETPRYWQSGILRLLRYEPRFAAAEYRRRLPRKAQDALEKAKTEAGLLIKLSPAKIRVTPLEPIRLSYAARKNTPLPLEDYCLAFHILSGEPGRPLVTEGGEGVPALGFAGHTGPLDFREEPVVTDDFRIDRRLPAGQYVIVCTVEDHVAYTPQAVAPRPVPVIYWCEPAVVQVDAQHER